jgi:hypothetical protein
LLNGVLKEELGFQGYGEIGNSTSIHRNMLTSGQ